MDVKDRLKKQHLEILSSNKKPSCLIGFDGFTDELSSVVATRESPSEFVPMEYIEEFGKRIVDSGGVSCNIELVPKQTKLGGNAPILANALLEGDHQVMFIGAIGKDGAIEPLFQDMAKKCKVVIPIAPSGHTDALEFADGKVLLGKHESIVTIGFDTILEHVNKTDLIQYFDAADLFVSANWTMFPLMNNLWSRLQEEIVPFISKRKQGNLRHLFVDLADPAKRTDKDILEALTLLTKWNESHQTILGLNAAESARIAKILGIDPKGNSKEELSEMAKEILEKLKISQVLIHTKAFATVACSEGVFQEDSPPCPRPKITTGAGDNFNAGYCNGLLYKLTAQESLICGIATAGFYIRNAKSPTFDELLSFISKMQSQSQDLS